MRRFFLGLKCIVIYTIECTCPYHFKATCYSSCGGRAGKFGPEEVRKPGSPCRAVVHLRKVTSTFETSRPTWVSVQDVVLNKLRPSTQPSQPLPELSHFYHNTQETRCLLMSLWFLLVCHSLTQNRCGVAS